MRGSFMKVRTILSSCLLAGALMLPVSTLAQDEGDDLDAFNQQTLEAALNDELDDIFETLDPDGFYSDEQVVDAVMAALSDNGDQGNEDIISFDELEAEMAEIGTTVEDEVIAAVEEADNYAALSNGFRTVAGRNLQLAGDDRVMTRAAFGSVKRRLTVGIRRFR